MPITKFDIQPGIHKESTSYAAEGYWYDCDKIRFRSGKAEKIGGWVKASQTFFKGVARIIMNWTLLTGDNCLAIGTNKKFYIESSSTFYDITPIRFTDTKLNPITTGAAGTNIQTYTTSAAHGATAGDYVTLSGLTEVDGICTDTYTNPFTTVAGSNIVLVTSPTPHYAAVGDSVTFAGAGIVDGIPAANFNTTLLVLDTPTTNTYHIQVATNATTGGITGGGTVTATYLARLNKEFSIIAVPTSTTFTFQTINNAVTGGVTGGGTGTAAFQITAGNAINIEGGGWGAGTWSRSTWGSVTTGSSSGITMRMWSTDNFGQDLIYAIRDGAIYYWSATSGFSVRGVLLSSMVGASDVPAQVTEILVTDERHVVAAGATDRVSGVYDPLLIRWCDQENPVNWTPSITNTAGSQRIPLGSYVTAALASRQENLIWTDQSLHSLQYVGPPYTFGLQTLADNVNIAGPNAAVNVNNVTYWMGLNRFWVYSGRVQNLPCSVQRFVFGGINESQLAQVYATTNDNFTEVTWFYCSTNSTSIDRYVTYHYEDKLWTVGSMSRTTMTMKNGYPYGTYAGDNDDGILFQHEVGYDDGTTNPPSPITAYIESGDFDIHDGDKLLFVDRVIPDMTFDRSTVTNPTVTLSVETKKFPGEPTRWTDNRTVAQTLTVDQYTKQVWVRLRGRQMKIKVTSDSLGVCWLLGITRANVRLDGRQ